MPQPDFLHKHPEFPELIRIVARDTGIDPALVEKDYWIMHCLFGLQKLGYSFELKGGTSLSKGLGIIDRFSEDIDLRIEPPAQLEVKTGKNHTKDAHNKSREQFYDWLAKKIAIDGIISVTRDIEFDDKPHYRSGGIRLHYDETTIQVESLKEGVLLEVGFDTVAPNAPRTISSWAYDAAKAKVEIADNRAIDVLCYHPGYTLVEKLQTLSTKFRRQQEEGTFATNFMRHYYDVYRLLLHADVQAFIGTEAYKAHKAERFRQADNPEIAKNQAFLLDDAKTRAAYEEAYNKPSGLYYRPKPSLAEILATIKKYVDRL
jgi:hypothetical protein